MTALDLGLFEILRKPKTGPDCTHLLECRPEIITLLCDGLVTLGLLEKTGERFRNSEITMNYLVDGAPFSQQNALAFQKKLAGYWADLPRITKEGPVTCDRAQMFRDVIIPSMAENCRCGLLQQVTARVAAIPEFSAARRLLDLGGGYDIIFSSSNPGGKVPELIPKIAGALNSGGLFINKQAIDDAPYDPWLSLEWNLWTFDGVQKQAARYVFANSVPFAEYNRLLADHGFVVREVVPIDAQSAMTIAEKVG